MQLQCEQKLNQETQHIQPINRHDWMHGGLLFVIFAVSLTLRLWFNFYDQHINCAYCCDASEYLRNAEAIWKFPYSWSLANDFINAALLQPTHNLANLRATLAPLNDFYISGPIFPLFLVSCFVVTGVPFDMSNWQIPLAMHSLISACIPVLIVLIGVRAWGKAHGYTAGIISAFYPGFIVNSGRLYSETFAAFLLLLVAFLTIDQFKRKRPVACFFIGLLAGALQLTRSIMFILSLLVIPFLAFRYQGKRTILAISSFLLGLAVVLSLWSFFGRVAFGKGAVVIDRVGHYNLFVGTNVESSGWLSYPYPDTSGIEQKSLPGLLLESYRKSPGKWLQLMLDKPIRLFKFPWNDFRMPIGPFSAQEQVLFHQLVVLLGALGIVYGLTTYSGSQGPVIAQVKARFFLLGILVIHLVYLLFITVPRYNLTAMTSIILFSSAGVIAILKMLKLNYRSHNPYMLVISTVIFFWLVRSDLTNLVINAFPEQEIRWCIAASSVLKMIAFVIFVCSIWSSIAIASVHRPTARILAILMAVLFVPSIVLPARAHGRLYERQYLLNRPGQIISQEIKIPIKMAQSFSHNHCFLIVDADGIDSISEKVKFHVNGKLLHGPMIPGLPLSEELLHFKERGEQNLYLECEYIFDCLTAPAGLSNVNLRQWFFIPVPSEYLLKEDNPEQITIKLEKLDWSSTAIFGSYVTGSQAIVIPSPGRYSWEKSFYGVENDKGLTDTRYDTKLQIRCPTSMIDRSDTSGAKSAIQHRERLSLPFVRLLVTPALPDDGPWMRPLTDRSYASLLLTGESTVHSETISTIPPYRKNDLWLVRIKGKLKAFGDSHTPAIIPVMHSIDKLGKLFSYQPVWLPRTLDATNMWNEFDLSFPLAPSGMPGKVSDMEITFYARSPYLSSSDRQPQRRGGVEYRDLTVSISKLAHNPLKNNYGLF